jgi:DNA-binding NtrC family response regulator
VKERGRLLLVEDSEAARRAMAVALRAGFSAVDEEADGERAIERLTRGVYAAVVTDLRLPGSDGLDVLRAAREHQPGCAVVIVTGFGTVEFAVQAMKLGACDVVCKPLDLDDLEARVMEGVRRARALRPAAQAGSADPERPDLVLGASPGLRRSLVLVRRVAASRSTVLLTGETGTGKELFAGAIHALSPRAKAPFVKVNCAALPDTLLESELFGHERGAFTGADRMRVGRFEQAHHGTLFLDEIGDMSLFTQSKLLRVLQDQEFHRLGGTRALRTDARIVAATNQDLEVEIRHGRFRQDLYFRLNVVGIHLPALRDRPEDVSVLAGHFLELLARELGRPARCFGPAALRRLRSHDWPGNVRELRNVLERAVLLADGPCVEDVRLGPEAGQPIGVPVGARFESLSLREAERELVLASLRRSDFVQKLAAQRLGVSRRKLNYMIQRLGITHPSWRRNRGSSGQSLCDG